MMLRQYWPILAIIVGVAAFYMYAFRSGVMAERAVWEQKIEAQRQVKQAQMDKNGKALEKALAYRRTQETKLRSLLNAEKAKNSQYRDCVVPDDGLRILEKARSGRLASF